MPYLCFDIGSSSVKSAVISEEGNLLGFGRAGYSMVHGPDGAHEIDPGSWAEALFISGKVALSAARAESAASSVEIRAISVSGNGPTLLAADSEGKPIRPALSWMDRRAHAEAEAVSRIVGFGIDPGFYLPKALMLWNRYEDIRVRTRSFFSCPEYLVFILSGSRITYLPHTGYEPYIWNREAIGALGLPKDLFPPFVGSSSKIGGLNRSSSEILGLSVGIPIVSAFPDFLAAIVGSAAVEEGIACDRSGTSEALNLCAGRPYPDRRILSLQHPVEGLWNLSGGVSAAGAALEWIDGIIASAYAPHSHTPNEQAPAIELPAASRVSALAASSTAGARGLVFLPYLAGERAPLWDPDRRGAFAGLSLEHGREDMARAVCESLAFGLRLVADLTRSEGISCTLIRTSGFAARDDFLCSLKAEVLGIPLEAPSISDCELVGDAAACAVALGDSASLKESSRILYRPRRRFDPRSSGEYDIPYEAFNSTLAALEPVDASRAKARRS